MMKRRNKTLLQAALTLLLALGCAGTVAAQQPHYGQPEERIFRSDTVRNDFGEREVLHRLDSLASWSRHYVDYRVYEPELESSPAGRWFPCRRWWSSRGSSCRAACTSSTT